MVDRPLRRTRLLVALSIAVVGIASVTGIGTATAQAPASCPPSPVHLTERPLDAPPTSRAHVLLVNAHNAGDRLMTAHRAAAAGPGMIEIDVTWADGVLSAAHQRPVAPAAASCRNETLAQAWQTVSNVPATLLDLKSNTPAAVEQVSVFLVRYRGPRRVYVSTPSLGALQRLQAVAPGTIRLLSVSTPVKLAQLLSAGPGWPMIDGVSIKESLLTRLTVRALRARNLLVQPYTVNRMSRINELAAWGITGVTTDDLTIARALTSSQYLTSGSSVASAVRVTSLRRAAEGRPSARYVR